MIKRCKFCDTRITSPKDGITCRRCQHYWRKYKIRVPEYNQLFELQDGQCAICGTADPKTKTGAFCIDHCHKSGTVRGLLCVNCNTGIGSLMESPEIFKLALNYLEHTDSHSYANTGSD